MGHKIREEIEIYESKLESHKKGLERAQSKGCSEWGQGYYEGNIAAIEIFLESLKKLLEGDKND